MFHKAHILPAVLLFFTLLLVSSGAFSVSAAQDPLDPYWDHDASWLIGILLRDFRLHLHELRGGLFAAG